MSYIILINCPPLSLNSNANASAVTTRKPRRNILCCCPFSGLDTNKSGLARKPIATNAASNANPAPLPPSPSFLHLMGLIHYAVRSFPYHYPLRDLANAYGPLVHVKLGEVSTVIVSSADIAKEVLKTSEYAFLNRPRSIGTRTISNDYTDVILSPYNDYWKQMRNISDSKFLSAEKVRSMEHMRKDEASVVIKSIQSTCGKLLPVNLTDEISLFMSSVTCRALFGDMCLDSRDAVMSVKLGVSLGASFGLADIFPSVKVFEFFSLNKYQMLKLRKKMDKVLDSIIDDHRKNLNNEELDRENFLDALLRFKESEEDRHSITDDNIKSVVADMVTATETSSVLVGWAMTELMRNPRVMEKAQDEIRRAFNGREMKQESEIQALKYLKLVIKETLRLHPPTSVITRACTQEIEIEGYRIPLDANIIVNSWAIGRDPVYWTNPESFKPERFEASRVDFMGAHFEYLPFGAGKRICSGIALALANVDYLLAQLLYHFDWKLPPGMTVDDIDMTETDGIVVARKNNLYLIATPYVLEA